MDDAATRTPRNCEARTRATAHAILRQTSCHSAQNRKTVNSSSSGDTQERSMQNFQGTSARSTASYATSAGNLADKGVPLTALVMKLNEFIQPWRHQGRSVQSIQKRLDSRVQNSYRHRGWLGHFLARARAHPCWEVPNARPAFWNQTHQRAQGSLRIRESYLSRKLTSLFSSLPPSCGALPAADRHLMTNASSHKPNRDAPCHQSCPSTLR